MTKELISVNQLNQFLQKVITDGAGNSKNIKKSGKIYDGNSIAEVARSFAKVFDEKNADFKLPQMVKDATVQTGGMYLSQQLQEILPQILNQVYPEMPALKILTVDNSGALMQSLIQRVQSFNGRHQAGHETSNTAGVITVNRAAREQLIFPYTATSSYDDIDLKRSMLLNENIDTAIIEAHQRSYQTLIDYITFKGITLEEDGGGSSVVTEGLTNYSGVISANYLTSGATFAVSDGLTIYNEIARLWATMIGQGKGAAELYPTHIVLPPKQYAKIASTFVTGSAGAGSTFIAGDTVLTAVERNLRVKVYASSRCELASNSGTDLLIMLSSTSDNMKLFIPQPLMFAPITIQAFKYILDSRFRIAGVGINRNNAIGYLKTI